MTQLALFDIVVDAMAKQMDERMMALSDERLARRKDPETSKRAAERSVEFSGKHESLIFAYLCGITGGATYREIAAGTKLEPVAVARRMKRLQERAGVYADGKRDGMQIWKVSRPQ